MPEYPSPETPLLRDGVSEGAFIPIDGNALIRACYTQYQARLLELAQGSLEMASDLFEAQSHVPDGEVEQFRLKRAQWIERFRSTLDDLFERRMNGERRKGRRPDADSSVSSLKVLTPFDHEKQAALVVATNFLRRFTAREMAALDLRVETLLERGPRRDIDNPFSVDYLLDAVGATSRAIYPNPRIWRPLMERVLGDLTPAVNKAYISLNRYLADRNVLPEIKAALRARSAWRPAEDSDLIPAFSRMLAQAGDVIPDIVVPESFSAPGAPPGLQFLDKLPAGRAADPSTSALGTPTPSQPSAPPPVALSPEILAGLAALAKLATAAEAGMGSTSRSATEAAPGAFPDLDPLMALGTSSPLFATLAAWQKLDLRSALAQALPQSTAGADSVAVPLNLIPHIRVAVADQMANPTDRITMDVIALLFDYIFRDGSIPDETRNLFGRLQVPIVKAALLDRAFFADRKHPARRLLDHLADGAVGASSNDVYKEQFTSTAAQLIDEVCRDFEVDVTVFEHADAALMRFLEQERAETTTALKPDVDEALRAEDNEKDRAEVQAVVRDKLAGLSVPFEIRSFAETIWTDYVTQLRIEHGAGSPPVETALRTLDDMLWSIVAKERTAQKSRLTKMIPTLVGGLRRAITLLQVPAERAKAFFDTLYGLHIAAIKPPPERTDVPRDPAGPAEAEQEFVDQGPTTLGPAINVHDYVSEMVPGTWMRFDTRQGPLNARLAWISPLRTKYIFTSRSRSRAVMYSPEELAYELGAGRAALIVEPVPLFDRAVSAALNTLAARTPADRQRASQLASA